MVTCLWAAFKMLGYNLYQSIGIDINIDFVVKSLRRWFLESHKLILYLHSHIIEHLLIFD